MGLFYNYFRFYDPATGRYIENDPIDLQGGLNRYGYVGGSPLHYVDPKGLAKWDATYYSLGMGTNYGLATVGYTHWWYTLESKCTPQTENKYVVKTMVLSGSIGLSKSLAIFGRFSASHGTGTFDDNNGEQPNPYAFEGGYASGVATALIYFSPHGHVKMGSATGDISGIGISTDILSAITSGGMSIIESIDMKKCGCE